MREQPAHAVRSMIVVVAFELTEHGCGVWLVMIRRRSSSSRRTVPTKRSAIAFARGARSGAMASAASGRPVARSS